MIKRFFLYNIIFWRIHKIKRSHLGFMDIDRKIYYEYVIRHIITNKILDHTGWGSEMTQESIICCNKC